MSFLKVHVVVMHIKFKGMERRAPCKRIFCPYTHMTRGVRSNGQNFFSECGHVAYPGGGWGGGGGGYSNFYRICRLVPSI